MIETVLKSDGLVWSWRVLGYSTLERKDSRVLASGAATTDVEARVALDAALREITGPELDLFHKPAGP